MNSIRARGPGAELGRQAHPQLGGGEPVSAGERGEQQRAQHRVPLCGGRLAALQRGACEVEAGGFADARVGEQGGQSRPVAAQDERGELGVGAVRDVEELISQRAATIYGGGRQLGDQRGEVGALVPGEQRRLPEHRLLGPLLDAASPGDVGGALVTVVARLRPSLERALRLRLGELPLLLGGGEPRGRRRACQHLAGSLEADLGPLLGGVGTLPVRIPRAQREHQHPGNHAATSGASDYPSDEGVS